MTEPKTSDLTQSVRGLLVSIAVVVLGNLIGGDAGPWVALAGIIGFLYFALATVWALGAAGFRRRSRRN